MLKNISRLECIINEKSYQLLCEMTSPLHEVKEALFQFIKYIGHIEDSAKTQQEALKSEKINEVSKESISPEIKNDEH